MSGFGIYEQMDASSALAREGKRWREQAFLHQLAANGAMMLAPNHDELWRECMQTQLGQPAGASWEHMSSLLRRLPAHDARRRLWQASYQWWMNTQRLRLTALAASARTGSLGLLTASTPLRTLDEQLVLRAAQLHQLQWCLTDDDDQVIEIADA